MNQLPTDLLMKRLVKLQMLLLVFGMVGCGPTLEEMGPIGKDADGRITSIDLRGTQVTDAGLVHLKGLTSLRLLALDGTQVTDAGLAHLQGFTNLDKLIIRDTLVTDAGLAHLKVTSLKALYLGRTQITDAGLAHLNEELNLASGGTQITDAGLVHLKGLTSLEELTLGGCTQVTNNI